MNDNSYLQKINYIFKRYLHKLGNSAHAQQSPSRAG